jgi:hypothetical protein
MMGARKAGLLHRLINDQTLPGILVKMPMGDEAMSQGEACLDRRPNRGCFLDLHRLEMEGWPERSGS